MAANQRNLRAANDHFTLVGSRRKTRAFEIFHAVDSRGRPVVIKRARRLDALGWRRFRREIRLGHGLKIGGLATVLDRGRDWIAFESLEDQLSHCSSTWKEADKYRVLQQVATILAQLHASGVVHRDLKPSHILFRGHEPVIIDFGVAGLMADDSLEGAEVVGSPAWMAPEQALGAPPAPAADIWSLCAVAYWLLCGQTLFKGDADAVLKTRQNGYVAQPDLSILKNRRLAAFLAAGFGPAASRPGAAEFSAAINNYR